MKPVSTITTVDQIVILVIFNTYQKKQETKHERKQTTRLGGKSKRYKGFVQRDRFNLNRGVC